MSLAPRILAGFVAALVVAALAPQAQASARDRGAARPNIVVIQADDLNLDQASPAFMPELDARLRRQGVDFSRYFVSLPECCPSRATLLTGQYAHNSGVRGNLAPLGGYTSLRQRHTLPVWLGRRGYRTAHVGKYLNGYGNRSRREVPRGWDRWWGAPAGNAYRMYDYTLNHNGRLRRYGSDPSDYQTDVYARLAARFVSAAAKRRAPFFLAVNPLAPHTEVQAATDAPCDGPRAAPRHEGVFSELQFNPPPNYDERDVSDKPSYIRSLDRMTAQEDRFAECSYRRQRESVLALDDLVAKVMRALRRSGELGRTYVIFTSDNGYFNGEHRIRRGKNKPYAEAIGVPLVIRGPGVERGSRYPEVAANVDIAPTILGLARARGEATVPIDGVNLAPALLGKREPRARRQIAIEFFEERYWPPYLGVVNRRYSFWRYRESGERELYDLSSDPFQLRNLAYEPEHAVLVQRLAERARKLSRCSGGGCR